MLPADRVWRKGAKGWVEAGTVPDLFPDDGPPPLPADEPGTPQGRGTGLWTRLWADKLVFLAVCFVVCFGLSFALPPLFGTTTRRTGYSTITEPAAGAVFTGNLFGLASVALFVTVVVLAVLRFRHTFAYMSLQGKWVPVDGKGEPLEFSGLNTVTRGDGLTGTYVVHRDKRLEITSGGQVAEVWQLVKVDTSELVIRDATGTVRRFKKKNANPFASLFESKRVRHLDGSWQPVTDPDEWLQFTRDGAAIFSDGSAGRYSVAGEEPQEVIEIEMVGGRSRRFRIVSLTSSQLVIAEGNETTTFRRPGRSAADRRSGGGPGAGGAGGPAGEPSGKGVLGSLFSFLTYWRCLKCGQRAAEQTGTEVVSDVEQAVQSRLDPVTRQVRQMVVNFWTEKNSYRCKSCNHQWSETEQRSRIA